MAFGVFIHRPDSIYDDSPAEPGSDLDFARPVPFADPDRISALTRPSPTPPAVGDM
jgi:hypothetical protein